jgi:hypothetical protein
MSRVFKRPMFKRGGGVNMNGIMSGIRDEYQDGGPTARERYEQIIKNYENPAIDPLSKLLIQGGLRGLSETRGGGTLANLAMAFQEPTDQLFSDLQRRKDMQREAELAGLEMDISDEEKRRARIQQVEDIEKKYQNQVNLQLLKNAQGGDKTAVQKLADQAISLGQFPNTEEGRKQAFEYFTLSSGDLLRSSMQDRISDYAKTNFPGEDMVGTAKATFVIEMLPKLKEKNLSVDILKPYINTKKEIKLEKLTPQKVYFDVATQRPLFFDGTGLKPIEL